jgi:hypothetical protein
MRILSRGDFLSVPDMDMGCDGLLAELFKFEKGDSSFQRLTALEGPFSAEN